MADWIPNGQLGCYLSRSPIVIKRSDTAMPIEIGWFINGQVAESIPVMTGRGAANDFAVGGIQCGVERKRSGSIVLKTVALGPARA